MSTTITKVSSYRTWRNEGTTIVGSAGAGTSYDFATLLSNYYTKTELQGVNIASIDFSNIDRAYHNYTLGLQGGLVVGDSDNPDSSGTAVDDEFYHLDYANYALIVEEPGADQYFGTNALGVKGWYDYEEASGSGSSSTYLFDMSLVEDSLGVVTFDNDEDTPGNSKYYGTNSGGTKGWFDLPAGGSSLWEDAGTDLISPIASAGVGIEVDGVYIKDSSVYTADGSLQHFTVQAGDASGGAGTDAGNLILKAGDAILADSGSTYGNIYLVPGNPYATPGFGAYIYLGNNSYIGNSINMYTLGTPTDISLNFIQKGAGTFGIGTTTGTLNLNGANVKLGNTPTMTIVSSVHSVTFASSDICTMRGGSGSSSHNNGYNLTIKGGSAYTVSGDGYGGNLYLNGGSPFNSGNGGNVYIYGGQTTDSVGIDGDTYFGDGSIGMLKEVDSSDVIYVVTYNPDTGKLGYTQLV